MPEQDDRDPTVNTHGFVYRAPTKLPRVHTCLPPINWFGRRFGDGSIWECWKCGGRQTYSRPQGAWIGIWI